jgi:hypothetical protein
MTLWQDIRYGFRMLAASPGFTTVAVLSLAIGIGANCAIFSFADALLLRPLPVARPGEVLSVGSRSSLERESHPCHRRRRARARRRLRRDNAVQSDQNSERSADHDRV